MLNDGLYEALKKVFGRVVVENRGQRASINATAPTAVSRKLRQQAARITGFGEQYRVNCPFCHYNDDTGPDTKGHLWISHIYSTEIQVGGQKLDFGWSPARCYRRDCMGIHSNKMALQRMITNGQSAENFSVDGADESSLDPSHPPKVDFPPWISLTDEIVPPYVHEYLAGRGLTAQELERDWGAVLGADDFYIRPSIVFPIYQRDEYVSWQSRYVGDDMEQWPNGEEKPKYHIPRTSKKAWMLYNMDRAKFTSPGVLVEGIFDCVKVGMNSMCILGKKPSEFQCKLLNSFFRRGRLVWIPDENDPQSIQTALEMAPHMMSAGIVKEVKVVRLPSDDPGKFNREAIWQLIREQTKWKC